MDPKIEETETKIRLILARAIWNQDNADDMPESKEDRAAAFKPVRKEYLKKARKLINKLNNQQVSLSLSQENS